jgi:hypothetical protein
LGEDAVQDVLKRIDPNEIVLLHTKEIIPEHIKGLNPVIIQQGFNLDYKRLTSTQRFELDLIFRVKMKKQRDEYYDYKRKKSNTPSEYENIMDHYDHYRYLGSKYPEPELHVICEMCHDFVRTAKLSDILTEARMCNVCGLRPGVREIFRRVDPDRLLKTICMGESE